jgi:hypothetical protein
MDSLLSSTVSLPTCRRPLDIRLLGLTNIHKSSHSRFLDFSAQYAYKGTKTWHLLKQGFGKRS